MGYKFTWLNPSEVVIQNTDGSQTMHARRGQFVVRAAGNGPVLRQGMSSALSMQQFFPDVVGAPPTITRYPGPGVGVWGEGIGARVQLAASASWPGGHWEFPSGAGSLGVWTHGTTRPQPVAAPSRITRTWWEARGPDGYNHAWRGNPADPTDLGILVNGHQTVKPTRSGANWNLFNISPDGALHFVEVYGSVPGAPPPPKAVAAVQLSPPPPVVVQQPAPAPTYVQADPTVVVQQPAYAPLPAPVYAPQPTFVQPAPVYGPPAPAPVFVQPAPAPVYAPQPTFIQPAPPTFVQQPAFVQAPAVMAPAPSGYVDANGNQLVPGTPSPDGQFVWSGTEWVPNTAALAASAALPQLPQIPGVPAYDPTQAALYTGAAYGAEAAAESAAQQQPQQPAMDPATAALMSSMSLDGSLSMGDLGSGDPFGGGGYNPYAAYGF
jgi:hypothetical protein